MINRRSVLSLAAATVAGTFASVSRRSAGANWINPVRLCRAVFDQRYEECVAFARDLEFSGVATSGIRSDVAELWYQDLRPQLRRTPLPFAGLTDRAALFCLEELARDVSMRVLYRIDRTVEQSGRVRHAIAGPESVVEAARDIGAREDFGRVMARLASRTDALGPSRIAPQKRTGPFSPQTGTVLVSWVIA